jgi:hypothetical protein
MSAVRPRPHIISSTPPQAGFGHEPDPGALALHDQVAADRGPVAEVLDLCQEAVPGQLHGLGRLVDRDHRRARMNRWHVALHDLLCTMFPARSTATQSVKCPNVHTDRVSHGETVQLKILAG